MIPVPIQHFEGWDIIHFEQTACSRVTLTCCDTLLADPETAQVGSIPHNVQITDILQLFIGERVLSNRGDIFDTPQQLRAGGEYSARLSRSQNGEEAYDTHVRRLCVPPYELCDTKEPEVG